jgi:hypothetical protein
LLATHSGGQRCGELVDELVKAGVGSAFPELVEGGDRGPVALDPLTDAPP